MTTKEKYELCVEKNNSGGYNIDVSKCRELGINLGSVMEYAKNVHLYFTGEYPKYVKQISISHE